MEIINTFKVTVRCKHIETVSEDSADNRETYSDKTMDLYLNSKDAMMLLFKFTPAIFKMSNGMTMIMKFTNEPDKWLISLMILVDLDAEKCLVLNKEQFWSEVLEAYENMRIMDKLQVISSLTTIREEDETEDNEPSSL